MSEVRSPLQQFLARLTDLGATPDEVQAVTDHWDELDPDNSPDPEAFTLARRAELLGWPDQELTDLLAAGRAEYEVGTTTEAEADEREWTAAYDAALAEAAGRIGGNVEAVLAWVGDDQHRARAVINLESAASGAGRKTLLGPLEALLPEVVVDAIDLSALAWVGDTVGHAQPLSALAWVGDTVGHAQPLSALAWVGDTPTPAATAAAGRLGPGQWLPVMDDGTVVPPAATEAHRGAQGPQPEVT